MCLDMQRSMNDIIPDGTSLEEYGVDWEALRDPTIGQSHLQNNGFTGLMDSWLDGADAPPQERMSLVEVPELNAAPLTPEQCGRMLEILDGLMTQGDVESKTARWNHALAYARSCNQEF